MAKTLVNARRAIFSAARELMDARGYDALTMRDVAGGSGVALGTIYNYYENKAALVRDMMLVQWVSFMEKQAAIAATRHGVYVKLFRLYQEYCRFACTFSDTWDMQETAPGDLDAGGALYSERLAACIESMLLEEAGAKSIRLRRSARDTARFIAMNFVAMSRMPGYHYELFEGMLKEIL